MDSLIFHGWFRLAVGGWFKSYPQGQPTPFQCSQNNIYKLLYTQPKFDKTKNPTWKSLFGWKMPLNLWNVSFNSRVSNYSKWPHTTKPNPNSKKKTTRHQNAQNQHLLEVQHSSQNIGGTFAHPERKHLEVRLNHFPGINLVHNHWQMAETTQNGTSYYFWNISQNILHSPKPFIPPINQLS